MLNPPPNYPITLSIDKTENPPRLWPCIPRIGESVEPENGGKYRITEVIHAFGRPTAQIVVVLEKTE